MSLRTERLVLRAWRDDDLAPFAALNADPEVMFNFPAVLTRQESDTLVERLVAFLDGNGWGLWAVEVPGVAPFIGFIGLSAVSFAAPFVPAVEVGWRLARPSWGRGYAPEGAAAALDLAFGPVSDGGLGLDEVVSFTPVANAKSRRVMEKLGLTRNPADDFDHPRLATDCPVRRHVLYRLDSTKWHSRQVVPNPGTVRPSRPS